MEKDEAIKILPMRNTGRATTFAYEGSSYLLRVDATDKLSINP